MTETQLRSALATRQSSKLPWGRKNYFDRSRFDADLKRIQAFYSDRGYPDAKVTAFDVKLNAKQDEVDIALTIDEGEPVRIANLGFHGFEALPEDRMRAIRAAVPFKVGDVRDRRAVFTTQTAVLNELRDAGYPYARLWVTEQPAGPAQVAVAITTDPGPRVPFGPVEISGNKSVGDDIIRREMAYKPGDLFSRSRMNATQRGLYAMELFQFATVTVVDADEQFPEVKTRITVAEGKHQTVNFGVGYGTEEKGRVDGEYRHLNFLGGARSAGVHARWSSLDRGLRLNFIQPYFLVREYALKADGQQWHTFTPAYQSIVSGGRVMIAHEPRSKRHSWSVSFIAEHDTSAIAADALTDLTLRDDLIALGLDPTTGKQDGTLNAVAGDVQFTTTDSILNAHRGFQLAGHVEQAGHVVPGTFTYYAVSGDARHYVTLGSTVTIANRLQFGSIHGEGNESKTVPFSKKFFLGGATSVRGWGRYEMSPLSGSGLPLGGNSLFAFSSEGRLSLSEKLGVVAFIDGGNVWALPWEFHLDDLRFAIGPGLRYATPVGPIRFDVGYQLNPIPGLIVNGVPERRRWRMHFSIGQAF